MALSDFKPNRTVIQIRDIKFEVRGLGLNDISGLLHTHMEDLEHVFKLYENLGDSSMSSAVLTRFALALIKDAPGLVAHAIAIASDEPGAVETAATLPLPTQLKAIQAIGALTFEESGGIKKFVEEIMDLAMAIRPPELEETKVPNGSEN